MAKKIVTKYITDLNVTAPKLAANAVTDSAIVNNTISGTKILDDSLDGDKIVAGSIDDRTITVNSISGTKILDDSLDGDKIVAGSIDDRTITANTISGTKILDDSLDGDKIVAGSIDDRTITANTISGSKILDLSIDNAKIADSTIMGAKLSENAKHEVLKVKLAALRDGVLGITANVGESEIIVTDLVEGAATTKVAIGAADNIGDLTELGIFVGNVANAIDPGKVLIRMSGTDNGLADNLFDEVYGQLVEDTGIYTLKFFNADGTTHNLAENVALDFYFVEVYNLDSFPVDKFLTPSLGGVIDATSYDTVSGDLGGLTLALSAETSSREAADSSLQASISSEASSREAADSSLQASISDEASSRIAADNSIQWELDLVEGAIGSFVNGDGSIATNSLAAAHYIDDEITLTNMVIELDSQIFLEVSARTAADSSLQASISDEASSREAADSSLQASISDEASSRIAADSSLQASISDEASSREAADSSLQASISDEASSRIAADNSLQTQIDGLSGSIAGANFIAQFEATEDVSEGEILYVTSEGKVTRAQADNLATCTVLAGIAAENIASSATGNVALMGKVIVKALSEDLEIGGRAYVSATDAGLATKTAPNASGDVVHLVGGVLLGGGTSWVVNLEPHLEYIVE